MTFLPNNWNAIFAFYGDFEPEILAAGRNEWGIDPYMWDNGMIHMTPIEYCLWADIRACDAVLYPQYPVGRVFVDFANPVAKVAIECDGAAYHDAEKDAARDAMLERMGWTVYRFPGWMCKTDSDEETGAPGEALRRMKEICDKHRINRSSRERDANADEWVSMEQMTAQMVRALEQRLDANDRAKGARPW